MATTPKVGTLLWTQLFRPRASTKETVAKGGKGDSNVLMWRDTNLIKMNKLKVLFKRLQALRAKKGNNKRKTTDLKLKPVYIQIKYLPCVHDTNKNRDLLTNNNTAAAKCPIH